MTGAEERSIVAMTRHRSVEGDKSPLDRQMVVTRFPDMWAKEKEEANISLRTFASYLPTVWASSKERLPWHKLASFGSARSRKNCLRHDANMLGVDGCELDYDAGVIQPGGAADMLRAAGLAALVYSTPSSSPDAPRWRVLAPFSRTLSPDARARYVARLNGVLGGGIDDASFNKSQAYYAGSISGKPPVGVILIEGRAVDLADDLDAGALGKKGIPWAKVRPRRAWQPLTDLPALDAAITSSAAAALRTMCDNIRFASPGSQEPTLMHMSYGAGRLVRARKVDRFTAEAVILAAAKSMIPDEKSRPWSCEELAARVRRGIQEGGGA